MRPVVIGASGFLGANLVQALRREGVEPRCTGRRPSRGLALRRIGAADWLRVDLDKPDTLRDALEGRDVVFHCAAHYPRDSLNRDETLATGLRQTRNLLDASAAAGVRRLVYVSSMATVAPRAGRPSTERDVHDDWPGHGVYHDLKWALERLVQAEDRVEVAIACPGACVGPWDVRVGTTAILAALGRGMDPPHPDGWINLVDSRDVATALVRLGMASDVLPRVLLSGSNHTLSDLLGSVADRLGVARPSPPLPADIALRLADQSERQAHSTGARAPVVREIVDLIVHGMPVDTTLAETALEMQWTPVEQTVDDWASWARGLGILPKTERAPCPRPLMSATESSR